jgi:hypothetical protein
MTSADISNVTVVNGAARYSETRTGGVQTLVTDLMNVETELSFGNTFGHSAHRLCAAENTHWTEAKIAIVAFHEPSKDWRFQ